MAQFNQYNGHNKVAEESVIQGCGNDGTNVDSRFECPICLTWLRDPVLTSCGHKFCSQCINSWLQKDGSCCPLDNQPLKAESDLFRDLHTSREISKQRTPCPYQQFGCSVELSPIDLETHVNQCTYKRNLMDSSRIQCPFKDVGCPENVQTSEALETHLEKNINSHLTLVAAAIPRLTSLAQMGTSARAVESRWWDPPPKTGGNSTADEQQPDWQQLLKALYERIVVLEQQNRELLIVVSNQQNQLTTLQTSQRYNNDEMVLRHCNGIYIWRLMSFKEKLEAMTTDSLKMFYSPGFYTCPNGYKICARINVSSKDPRYLSLLVHMMKSENDDALDWPFYGLIRFVLVHPDNSEKNIQEATTSRPELEAFRKPSCELNKRSFGYTEFVPIKELTAFLQNDSLVFRIEVKAVCESTL